MPDTFELTTELVTLLRNSSVVDDLIGDENGAARIDPKRPYGNSDVLPDIARVLGWEVNDYDLTDDQRDRARALHSLTPLALEVVLTSGSFEPGTYRRTKPYGFRWELVGIHTYVTLTENNEAEGETWHYYIPTRGNEAALALLASAITAHRDPDDDEEPEYQLDLTRLPESAVDILVEHSDEGYMATHQKLAGRLVLPPDFAAVTDDHLYKGGIKHLVKVAE